MSLSSAAADRFFRAYHRHCVEPDEDTLFNLLNALHSLNDKMRKTGERNLFGSKNFAALRALRNLFHHEQELLHQVRLLAVRDLPIVSELSTVCLISSQLAEQAASREREHHAAILETLMWYGTAVDIQPCIFNGAVDVFEAVQRESDKPTSEEFFKFQASYDHEERYGLPHRVSGEISCHAGNVDRLLAEVLGAPAP